MKKGVMSIAVQVFVNTFLFLWSIFPGAVWLAHRTDIGFVLDAANRCPKPIWTKQFTCRAAVAGVQLLHNLDLGLPKLKSYLPNACLLLKPLVCGLREICGDQERFVLST